MSTKPIINPTKIVTFLACPVKYRWTFVDPRGRFYRKASRYYSFGISLHQAVEQLAKNPEAGVLTVHEATALVEDNWLEVGYSSHQEMEEARNEASDMLVTFSRTLADRAENVKTIAAEKLFSMEFESFTLRGRIDRLDEHPDGSLEIIDYKTGRLGVTDQDVADDIAMGCYQLLVRDSFPDRPVRATIHALRSGAAASASLSDADAVNFREDLERLAVQMCNTDWEWLTPISKNLCQGCDFLRLCSSHPDFELTSQPDGAS